MVLAEVGWTSSSVGLRWTEKVLQEWGQVMAQPLGAAEKTMLLADVRGAIVRREQNGVGAKASGVGERAAAAAERMFGAVGWRRLEWRGSRRARKECNAVS
jgi:hypothetical protein